MRPFALGNGASPGYQTTVDGVVIYLGVIPSDIIAKDYGKGTPEYGMHGGPPADVHFHHLIVALYDAKTDDRIADAEVTATVQPVGMSGTTKKLAPFMVGNAMTYCNYFGLPSYGRYRIDLDIQRPGAPALEARLAFDHTRGN